MQISATEAYFNVCDENFYNSRLLECFYRLNHYAI